MSARVSFPGDPIRFRRRQRRWPPYTLRPWSFQRGVLRRPVCASSNLVAQRRMTPPKNNPITMIGPTSVLRELGGGRRVEPQAED